MSHRVRGENIPLFFLRPNRHGHCAANPFVPHHLRDPPVERGAVKGCKRNICYCHSPQGENVDEKIMRAKQAQ